MTPEEYTFALDSKEIRTRLKPGGPNRTSLCVGWDGSPPRTADTGLLVSFLTRQLSFKNNNK